MDFNDILDKIYSAFDNDVAKEITAGAAEVVVRSIVADASNGETIGRVDGLDLGIDVTSGNVVTGKEFTYLVADGDAPLYRRVRLLDRWQVDAVRTIVAA